MGLVVSLPEAAVAGLRGRKEFSLGIFLVCVCAVWRKGGRRKLMVWRLLLLLLLHVTAARPPDKNNTHTRARSFSRPRTPPTLSPPDSFFSQGKERD